MIVLWLCALVFLNLARSEDIDGGYTEWGEWSACSLTCGGGVRVHFRTCTNPSPENGGWTCTEQNLGQHEETEICNTNECPACTPEPPPSTPCMEYLDVVVVIDSSGSIKPENYSIARQYIVELAERLHVSDAGTHIAIILYSYEAHVWHRFTDEQTIAAVIEKANELPYINGGTRTDKALELAAEEFFGWNESGDRSDKPNVAIVITDGHSNKGSKSFGDVVPPLNDANVRRIAIGIGKGIGLKELRQIASADNDVLTVSSYDELHSKLEAIMGLACEDQYPGDCDSWGSYGSCSKTCGGGVQSRSRTCPDNSVHLRNQRRHCNTNLCPGQQPCEDQDEFCPLYAASGECFRNKEIINGIKTFTLWEVCQKSCRRCNVDPACQDTDPYNCPRYPGNADSNCILTEEMSNKFGKHIQETTPKINGGFDVNELCQKSCNQCVSGEVDTPCQDTDPDNCPAYSANADSNCILTVVANGETVTHDLNELCQKSCNQCGGGEVVPPCQDTDPDNCPTYSANADSNCILTVVANGETVTHDLNELCQKSCNQCGDGEVVSPCQDTDPDNCPTYSANADSNCILTVVANGETVTHDLNELCQKSCNQCGGGEGGGEPDQNGYIRRMSRKFRKSRKGGDY